MDLIEQAAREMSKVDPEQSGQINDGDMGEYFWEKYRDRYIAMAEAAFAVFLSGGRGEGPPKK